MDHIQIEPPLKEDTPRIPSPYGEEIFYYSQVDLIIVLHLSAGLSCSDGKCELIDISIGFVPNASGMTAVEPLALYLSLYRFVNGTFPGTNANFTYTHTESSQDVISKSVIYLSVVKPEQANGEAFNIANTTTPKPWCLKLPVIARYFGLHGSGPGQKGWEEVEVWWNKNLHDYRRICKTFGLAPRELPRSSWVFYKADFTLLDRDHELSLAKMYNIGFIAELPLERGHYLTFDRMAEAKLILSLEALVTSPT